MKLLLADNDSIRLIADSAIGRTGLPWFIPDGGEHWCWRTARAYRVSKLGKSVSPKFAGRYIDAQTLLWVADAEKFDALDFMDGAVVCGKWLPLADDNVIPSELLARITETATIKNGDILAVMTDDSPETIIQNQHISLSLNNIEVLSFNIK